MAQAVTFAEFTKAIEREIEASVGKRGVPYTVEGVGMVYRRDRLTVNVAPHVVGDQTLVLVAYNATAGGVLGHRSGTGQSPYRLTPEGASDAAKLIGNWLDDPYLYT